MCLGIPLKIVKIDGKEAVGEANGLTQKIRVDLIENIQIGDYVMVHAGFAIEKMDKEQADEVIKTAFEIEKIAGA